MPKAEHFFAFLDISRELGARARGHESLSTEQISAARLTAGEQYGILLEFHAVAFAKQREECAPRFARAGCHSNWRLLNMELIHRRKAVGVSFLLLILAGAVPAQECGKPLTYRHFDVEEADGRVLSVTPAPAEPTPCWACDVSQAKFDRPVLPG